MKVEGAKAIVTGGSSGIGLATAELLASRGADVGLIARDQGRLEKAAETVTRARRSEKQRVWASACDVADFEAVWETFDRFEREVGPCDLLVNSAGIFLPAYFETMPMEWFSEHLDIDVLGVIYTCRAVVPRMSARGRGHIVNVASMAGFMGIFGYTAYSAAKYAVMGFSESLRSEMRPLGIGVTVVCPPDVDTPGLATERSLRPPETDRVAGNVTAIQPSAVASELVRGVERNKYLVIPGFTGKLYHFLKRLWPGLFYIVTDRDVRKARDAVEDSVHPGTEFERRADL
jgi:3-dehydrosphinganine reductase